jgi:hypothetical protein
VAARSPGIAGNNDVDQRSSRREHGTALRMTGGPFGIPATYEELTVPTALGAASA